MTVEEFAKKLLDMPHLTANEISLLIEAAYAPFTRQDLLTASNGRVADQTYEAAALTRTLTKLLSRTPTILQEKVIHNKKVYSLMDPCNNLGAFQVFLPSIARSKVVTLQTLRLALFLISQQNPWCTARYAAAADSCNVTPDYMSGTILPRALTIGLIEVKVYKCFAVTAQINHHKDDIIPGATALARNHILFRLNLEKNWDEIEKWL